MYTVVQLNNYNTPSSLPEADEMLRKINAFKQYDKRKKELIPRAIDTADGCDVATGAVLTYSSAH